MGHWEQIGRDNAEERRRRAALPGWRRAAARYGLAAFLAVAWVIAIAIVLKVLLIV